MFESVVLKPEGIRRRQVIHKNFATLLRTLAFLVPEGREFSLVKTKLEEASFFAVRGMALGQSTQVIPFSNGITVERDTWYDSYFKGDPKLPVGDTGDGPRSMPSTNKGLIPRTAPVLSPSDGQAPVTCLGSTSRVHPSTFWVG